MEIQYKITGVVTGVLVGLDPESLVTTRQKQAEVTFAGFTGDRHSGLTYLSGGRTPFYPRKTEIRNYRQVSIVSDEELAQIAAAMDIPEIQPEWLGANLSFKGIFDLTKLPPFTRLFFENGTVLVVQRDNEPCVGPGKVLRSQFGREDLERLFTPSARHRRGIVACVERPGFIQPGETVRAEIPVQVLYSPEKQ